MSTQTGSISFESTGTISQHVKQNYATLSQIKGQFATSSTGASTAAKVATIVPQNTGWTLYTGATVTVKFTSKNTTTTAPTLNVNNTGAKPIKDFNGNDLDSDAYNWPAGAAMSFTYDGTSWRLQDSDLMERVHSAETKIEQNAEDIALRATKEEVNNAIDDVKVTKSTCGRSIVTEDAADLPLLNLSIYGECQQDGTPTPDAPVEIRSVRGRNLLDVPTIDEVIERDTGDSGTYHTMPIQLKPNTTYHFTPFVADGYETKIANTFILIAESSSNTNWKSFAHASVGAVGGNLKTGEDGRLWINVYKNSSCRENYPTVMENVKGMLIEGGVAATRHTPYGTVAVVARGRNAWNEAWELGAFNTTTGANINNGTQIRSKYRLEVTPGETYYIAAPSYIWMIFYDGRNNVITEVPSGSYAKNGYSIGCGAIYSRTVTMPDNCHSVRFYCQNMYGTTYNNDICINVSDPDFNGQYEPYRESVSYIDLKGEELCKHSSTGSKYRDVLTIDASGHVTLEKRTQVETVTAVGTAGGTTTKYASLTVTPRAKRWSSSADAAADGYGSHLWNTMLAQDAAAYIGATWNSLYAYVPQSEEWEQTDFDKLVGMKLVDLLPPKDWYTIDLGYIDPPTTFDGGTVHVEAEIQPQICGSWWTKSGQEAGNAHQSSVKENAELRIAADGITSEVSKISSVKYVTTVYNYTLTQIKTYAAEGDSYNWTIASDDSIRVGDTVYVKVQDTTRTCPVYIKVKVTAISSPARITGISHGYEDVLPVDTIKSTINQSADSVKIAANHVDIEGAAIFSSGGAYDKSTTVVSTQTQWYSSTSATSKSGGSWGTTQPTVSAGRYIWQRELVTYANGTTAYKPSEAGVCIQGQTDLSSYSTTAQANNLYDAKGAANTVNNALENYKSTTNTTLQSLQSQVDGQIEAWYMDGAPAETSYAATATPTDSAAKTWTTKELKDRHLGDIYYDINTGHSWRWMEDGSNYKWQPIPDSDATAALAAAQDAQTMANSKRRIFTTQPTPPYDEGDLWVNGSEIRYCNQLKTNSGSYAASDWTLTATDDTLAQSAKNIADAAAPKTSAVSRTQRIYYRQTANGAKPGINETWLATSGTGYGNWSLTVPQLTSGNTKYPKLYTAVQTQTVAQQANNGTTCSCSPVQLDDSTTIIDGGNIITGSVAANKLDVYDATIQKIKSSAIDVSSINIGDLAGEIGGRNLVIQATRRLGRCQNGSDAAYNQGADDGQKHWQSAPIAVKPGEQYSLTTHGWTEESGHARYVAMHFTTDDLTWINRPVMQAWAPAFENYTWTVTAPDNAAFARVSAPKEAYETKMKLEKGNKPTDWTPAPEDIDSAIDNASKVASNYIHTDSTGINIYDSSLTNASKYYLRQTASGTYIYRNSYLKAKYEDTITLYGGTGATNTNTDANPKVELTSSDFKMTDASGTQRLLLNSTDGVIIGNPNKSKVQITDAGMTIYDTNKKKRTAIDTSGLHIFDASSTPVEVALFGSTVETAGTTAFARIGANNSSRFEISPTTLSAYTGTTKYFEVSASGLTWGNNVTAASQNYVTSQGYQTSSQVTNLINTNQNVIDAKKHTQVIVSATNVDYTADTCTLTARLYIDGVLQTGTSLKWQWYRDGTAQGSQITGATGTLNVTSTLGIAHRYSCKCTF